MNSILQHVIEKSYVHLENIQIDTVEFAESLGKVFRAHEEDDPYVQMVIEGDDQSKTPYASCRPSRLSLHTDYATFETPPRFTMTHCIQPDPNWPKYGESIIVMMDQVWGDLKRVNPALYEFVRNTPVPFQRNMEHNRYHNEIPKQTIVSEDNLIRFDRTLIEPALGKENTPNSLNLIQTIRTFEDFCERSPHVINVPLKKHDVLIIDNHRVLHSRGQCTPSALCNGNSPREVNLIFLN